MSFALLKVAMLNHFVNAQITVWTPIRYILGFQGGSKGVRNETPGRLLRCLLHQGAILSFLFATSLQRFNRVWFLGLTAWEYFWLYFRMSFKLSFQFLPLSGNSSSRCGRMQNTPQPRTYHGRYNFVLNFLVTALKAIHGSSLHVDILGFHSPSIIIGDEVCRVYGPARTSRISCLKPSAFTFDS